jgi:hypothetical protein
LTPSNSGDRNRRRIWFNANVRAREPICRRMRKEAPLAEADTALSLIFKFFDDILPPEVPKSPYVTIKKKQLSVVFHH